MKPENLHWFADEKTEELKCPECGETSFTDDWTDCTPYCEDCGEHAGIRCPKCLETFEHVWGPRRFKGY